MEFPKMIIGLDQSGFDKELIRYSHFIADTFGVRTAQFIHVVPYLFSSELLNEGLEALIGKEQNRQERVQNELAAAIKPVFDDLTEIQVSYTAREGHPQEELLQAIEDTDPDLLVLGKKATGKGSGIAARRVARKVTSAIWFVTEDAPTTIRRIMVPVDLSDYSLKALQTALLLKASMPDVVVTALHVIDVPSTGYRINVNREIIIERLKTTAFEELLAFTDRNRIKRTDVQFNIQLNEEFSVAHHIRETASTEKSDLIIMGAKGRSRFENFLFGSVTEKLVSDEVTCPVLILR